MHVDMSNSSGVGGVHLKGHVTVWMSLRLVLLKYDIPKLSCGIIHTHWDTWDQYGSEV